MCLAASEAGRLRLRAVDAGLLVTGEDVQVPRLKQAAILFSDGHTVRQVAALLGISVPMSRDYPKSASQCRLAAVEASPDLSAAASSDEARKTIGYHAAAILRLQTAVDAEGAVKVSKASRATRVSPKP
jgi:hypothetical protein